MIRTIFIFLALSLFLTKMYGQGDEIYRSEGMTRAHVGPSYDVNILVLDKDGTYKLMYQKFDSKKMKNKNIFYDLSVYEGIWDRKKDTLHLKSNNGDRDEKFLILNKNKIARVSKTIGLSPLKWKRVNY